MLKNDPLLAQISKYPDHINLMKSYQFPLFLLHFGNLWYAVTKKSLAASTPMMRQELGLTPSHIGQFSASFSLCYGIFKLIGGLLTDIMPATMVYSLGLLLGSVINMLIPALSDLSSIHWCWAINGAVQGGGGPSLSKVVIEQFPPGARASTWSSLLTANNVGYLLSPYLLMLPLYKLGWKGPFWVSGFVGVASAVSMLMWPVPLLDHAEAAAGSSNRKTAIHHAEKIPSKQSAPMAVMHTLLTVQLVLADALTYFLAKGMSDWTGNPNLSFPQ